MVMSMWTRINDLFLHNLNSIDIRLLVRGIPSISTLTRPAATLTPALLCVRVGRSELDDRSCPMIVFTDVNFGQGLGAWINDFVFMMSWPYSFAVQVAVSSCCPRKQKRIINFLLTLVKSMLLFLN